MSGLCAVESRDKMEEDIFEEFDNFDFGNNSDFQTGWAAIANILDPGTIGVEYLRAKIFFFSKHCKPVDLQKYLLWKKRKSASYDTLKQSKGDCSCKTDDGDSQSALQASSESENVNQSSSLSNTEPEISSCEVNRATESMTHRKGNSKTAADIDDSSSDDLSQLLHATSLDCKAVSESKTDFKDKDHCENKCNKESENSEDKSDGKNCDLVECDGDDDNDAEVAPSLSLLEIANHIQNGIPIPGLVKMDVQPTNLDPTPSNCARRQKPWEVTHGEAVES